MGKGDGYSDYDKKYYLSHVAENKEATRTWRAKNPEKKAEQDLVAKRRWRSSHPEENKRLQKVCNKKYYLLNNGWTKEMIAQTSLEQGGKCMICRQIPKPRTSKNLSGGLCADHAHTVPPEPRGLLCNTCNLALGALKDSPELCEAAAEYLRSWQ